MGATGNSLTEEEKAQRDALVERLYKSDSWRFYRLI